MNAPCRAAARRLLAVLCLAVLPAAAAPRREVPDFNLTDIFGRNYRLQAAEGRAVVLIFTGVGCPAARKTVPKLHDLRAKFGADVQFWLVNSYAGDSLRDCRKEFGEVGAYPLPYLRDTRQTVALAFGIQRTTEAVAVSTDDWQVFYQGAVDDQLAPGGERAEAQANPLADALTAFLAGQPVKLAKTAAKGCRITYAAPAEAAEAPTYAAHVAPLLKQHCVECHRDGGIGPFAFDGYARAKNYARMIEEVVVAQRMPPWGADPDFGKFAHVPVLSTEEAQTLIRWVQSGAPRGEGEDLLAAGLAPAPAWRLGTPDAVMRLPDVQHVPATGVQDYRMVGIPSPFTNEVWVSGFDVQPGNRAVVHHVILYAKWPGSGDGPIGKGIHLAGWAPGTPPYRYPAGAAKRIPAGAEFTAELHYTTTGTAATDQTEIAFYLAPGPQAHDVETRFAWTQHIDLPPGSDNVPHSAVYGFQRPALLYTLAPHMHMRGAWMKYELLTPDGKRRTLLHVPRYDFKWQHVYELAEPLRVPAGAWLYVTGGFDNSKKNLNNPEPGKRVTEGEQSWDEMFIGFFDAADVPEEGKSVAAAR
ncbi:MAG: redoxin domain-containing protein [Limisphaerales bacterium]